MKYIFFLLFSLSIYAQDTIPASKSVVALDRMNVVYRGVPNLISIAVNNAKSYVIYGNGVSKKDDGKYVLRPGSGRETKVFVEIENFDGTKVIEEHVFRVINSSAPKGTLNGYYTNRGELLFTLNELKSAIVGVNFIEYFGNEIEVKQFNIKIPNQPTITVSGNTFSEEIVNLFKKVKKNDVIIIFDIKGVYAGKYDGLIKKPAPITFRIVKE